jgi:hypothetical protein
MVGFYSPSVEVGIPGISRTLVLYAGIVLGLRTVLMNAWCSGTAKVSSVERFSAKSYTPPLPDGRQLYRPCTLFLRRRSGPRTFRVSPRAPLLWWRFVHISRSVAGPSTYRATTKTLPFYRAAPKEPSIATYTRINTTSAVFSSLTTDHRPLLPLASQFPVNHTFQILNLLYFLPDPLG